MAEMFRHALTDFPQWSPTALSLEPPIIQARAHVHTTRVHALAIGPPTVQVYCTRSAPVHAHAHAHHTLHTPPVLHLHLHLHLHLQFEDLLNEEEAKEMIDRCRSFGKFERSLVPLALHPLRLPRRATPPLGCHVVLHPLRLPHRATPP